MDLGSCIRRTCYLLSSLPLFVIPWTVAHQVPLSMGFFRQEDWNGLPFPPVEDLPDQRIEPVFPMSPAMQPDSLPAEPSGKVKVSQSPPTLCDPMD